VSPGYTFADLMSCLLRLVVEITKVRAEVGMSRWIDGQIFSMLVLSGSPGTGGHQDQDGWVKTNVCLVISTLQHLQYSLSGDGDNNKLLSSWRSWSSMSWCQG
jgi:hypothetical protein